MKRTKGFTIVELLVAISVIAVIGAVITEIFSRSLRGGNKAQIIAAVKQNGQAALESIDKTIRNSDEIVCPIITSSEIIAAGVNPVTKYTDTVAVVKDGVYTRFRYQVSTVNTNGYIVRDNPVSQGEPQELFLANICTNTPSASSIPVPITDTSSRTGTSVTSLTPNIFTRNKKAGFKDTLTISFNLSPGVSAPAAVAGQIDPVTFTTTIQVR